MTEQDRVREAIPIIETLQGGVTTDKYGLALQTMLDLATRYLSIKGVPGEKEVTGYGVVYAHNSAYNLGRQDALLGVLKVLGDGKLEEVIKKYIWCQEMDSNHSAHDVQHLFDSYMAEELANSIRSLFGEAK